MNPYLPTKRVPSPIARAAAAQAREQARLEAWHDEERVLIRAIRAAQMAESQVGEEAGRIFDRENNPVAPPPQIAGSIHPSRYRALAKLVASWSPNPREAIEPMRTVAQIAQGIAPDLAAETQRAQDAYGDFLARRSPETRQEFSITDPDMTAVSSEAEIIAALDREAISDIDLVVDDDAPVLLVKRGPGRPSKLERAVGSAVIDH